MTHKSRPCTVCEHPDARNIATALIAGASVREIATRYSISKSTVARHQKLHLRPRLRAAEGAGQDARLHAEAAAAPRVQALEAHQEALDVMRAMRELHQRTLSLLERAEASGDLQIALRAVREARGNLELLGRLDGSLDGPVAATGGNVTVTVQYIDRAVVVGGEPRRLEGNERGDKLT